MKKKKKKTDGRIDADFIQTEKRNLSTPPRCRTCRARAGAVALLDGQGHSREAEIDLRKEREGREKRVRGEMIN